MIRQQNTDQTLAAVAQDTSGRTRQAFDPSAYNAAVVQFDPFDPFAEGGCGHPVGYSHPVSSDALLPPTS